MFIVTDVPKTSMSLSDPGLPKWACQTQISPPFMTPITMELFSFSVKLTFPSHWAIIPLSVLLFNASKAPGEALYNTDY